MKYTRHDLSTLLTDMDKGARHPVYLIFGERYLCSQAGQEIANRLLPDEKSRARNLHSVDGDQENVTQTMNQLRTFSLFGAPQVIRVVDSHLFHSKAVGKSIWERAVKAHRNNEADKATRYLVQLAALGGLEADDDLSELSSSQWRKLFGFSRPDDVAWTKGRALGQPTGSRSGTNQTDLVQATLDKGIPETNHLLLITESVDKRKKLYKTIDEIGVIVDLSVESGQTGAARKDQEAVIRELITRTFSRMAKRPGPRVVDLLMERVGFHPVAAVREAEKVCLYCDDSEVVKVDDVNSVTGLTREEAIFELTDAFAGRDLNRTLYLQSRLLGAGLHPLVIIAGLRNLIRKLLFFRALQERNTPAYRSGQSFNVFQKGYLAAIKEAAADSEFLKGHPFVIYKGFQQAEGFTRQELINALAALLLAEFKLKGSAVRDSLILENFFFSMLV